MPRDSVPPQHAPVPPPPQRAGTAAAIVAACALTAGVTASFEGLRTKPYYDPAHVQTVCYGETEREMRNYTPGECLALLKDRQSADYAPAIAKCVPDFADERHRYAFAASIDAAYNAGIAAFCKSRMARAFNAGAWRQGCDLFAGWYATARINGKPTPLPGLQRRRSAERALCLKGEAPPAIVKADFPACVTVHNAPLLRTPSGRTDKRLDPNAFNDKGVS
jgi:lysozyme